jgi:hypothetical protein
MVPITTCPLVDPAGAMAAHNLSNVVLNDLHELFQQREKEQQIGK